MKIICAAIKYKNEIFIGHRHSDAYKVLIRYHPEYNYSEVIQGFLTGDNVFVDRKEAFIIAVESGQFILRNNESKLQNLYSIDLY